MFFDPGGIAEFAPSEFLRLPSGCAPCEGVGFQWVRIPSGNLVILAGSSSSDSGGNKRVEALNDKGSFQRLSECSGRNASERRAGPEIGSMQEPTLHP